MTTIGVVAHEGKTLGKGLEALRAALADAGAPDPPWRQVPKSKKAPKHVRQLLEEGVDRLLVWGGDGTVRRCIDTIVGADVDADVEVGILPAGTANLLAHGLGIPINLQGAVDVALGQTVRAIDIGIMNDEAFAMMAGTGFDALMIRDADHGSAKARLGRLSYVGAGMRNLGFSGAEVRVDVDGAAWFEGRAACVLVANMGRILGGIEAFPAARPDDGALDIGVVTARSRTDWLRIGARAIAGRIGSSPLVEITQGRQMKIRVDRTMPWQLDGGDRPRTKKFDVSVLPGRLRVCVPPA